MSVDMTALWTRPSLLLRIRDVGDADSWRTFVTIYAPLVYQYARRHSLQDADAADLTQDVMGEVTRTIRSFVYQPARGRFRGWLLAVTRRRFVRFNERRARYLAKSRVLKRLSAEVQKIVEDFSSLDAFEAPST